MHVHAGRGAAHLAGQPGELVAVAAEAAVRVDEAEAHATGGHLDHAVDRGQLMRPLARRGRDHPSVAQPEPGARRVRDRIGAAKANCRIEGDDAGLGRDPGPRAGQQPYERRRRGHRSRPG